MSNTPTQSSPELCRSASPSWSACASDSYGVVTSTLPEFRITAGNATASAQVCYRLDGMPLVIKLAAARVKILQVDQIATRLDDRFHLLTGGQRTIFLRHQTFRAAFDWSNDLLSSAERRP